MKKQNECKIMETGSEWMDFIQKRRQKEQAKFKRTHLTAAKRQQRAKEGYVVGYGDFYKEKPNQIKTGRDETVLLAIQFNGKPYRFGHPLEMVNATTILTHEPTKEKYVLSTERIYQFLNEKRYIQIFHSDYNTGCGKTADTTVCQCDLDDLLDFCQVNQGAENV